MPGSLPEGWCETALGDVAEVIAGQSPPGTTVSDWDGSSTGPGLPFIQGNAEFGARSPSPTKWCIAPAKRAEPGDTLLSVRAPVGETNRADGPLAIGRGIAAVRFRDIEPEFGWHALNHAKRAFERLAQGSTFEAIGAEVIKGLTLRIPPLAEQRAIAAVLDAVDDTIERTEAVIAATEELRRALLHELLTRGVPGMHSEWKHVPGLGTVPACWEVTTLGEAALRITDGVHQTVRLEEDGAVPFLYVSSLRSGDIDWESTGRVSMETYRSITRSIQPMRGDVLYAAVGSYGTAVEVTTDRPFAFQRHIAIVRPDSKRVTAGLLTAILNSSIGRDQSDRAAVGLAQKTVTLEALRKFRISLPSPAEQAVITELLHLVGERVGSEWSHLQELRQAKRATADALLSGRIRAAAPTEVSA